LNEKGDIYVQDYQRISIFNRRGEFLNSFPINGNFISLIAVKDGGILLHAYKVNHKVTWDINHNLFPESLRISNWDSGD